MKVKIAMAFLTLFVFAGVAAVATAQDTTETISQRKTAGRSLAVVAETTPTSTNSLRRKAALGRSRVTRSGSEIM